MSQDLKTVQSVIINYRLSFQISIAAILSCSWYSSSCLPDKHSLLFNVLWVFSGRCLFFLSSPLPVKYTFVY